MLQKISSQREKLKIKLSKKKINGIRISYNDKFVLRLKNKEIREKKRKLKEQIKLLNKSKSEFNKLMKLKPRDYKNIPDSEKKTIKFNYEHDKARKELIEERLEEIKKMTPVEYLNILNEETKEKLIGLCLDKKILDSFEDDGFTNYDDTEEIEDNDIEDAEEEDDDEEEEDMDN